MLTEASVTTILNILQAEGAVRLNKINGDWYSMYCPFHSNGQERRPSSGMLLREQYKNGRLDPAGWFHCFTCQKSIEIPEFIKELRTLYEISESALSRIQEIIGAEYEATDSTSLIPDNMMKVFNSNQAVNYMLSMMNTKRKIITDEELSKYRFTVPYMYERGLTDELIEKYDIGVDMDFVPPGRKRKVPCITFPVKDENGNCLFVARRSIANKNFFLPEAIEKPVYGIYELPKNTKSVVVCESCFNALTSVKYGRPAVALFGTGNTYQVNQLRRLGVREFILGFDPDEAGARATRKWKKILRDVAIVWSFDGIPEGKDINDLSFEEFNALELV